MYIGLDDLLAKTLVKTKSFLIWPERTDEGVLQPFVLDLTAILNYPSVFSKIAFGMLKVVKEKVGLKGFNSVAGVPLAGVPYATFISLKTNKPMLLVRDGGRKKFVEGLLRMGDRVLIVDDFVLTGRQILKTTNKIISEGGVVGQAVVILCQSRDAMKRLKENGIRLYHLVDFRSLVESLKRMDALTDSEYEALVSKT